MFAARGSESFFGNKKWCSLYYGTILGYYTGPLYPQATVEKQSILTFYFRTSENVENGVGSLNEAKLSIEVK